MAKRQRNPIELCDAYLHTYTDSDGLLQMCRSRTMMGTQVYSADDYSRAIERWLDGSGGAVGSGGRAAVGK